MDEFSDKQKLDLYMQSEQLAEIGHWHLNVITGDIYWSDEVFRIHGLDPKHYTPELSSALSYYHPEDRNKVQNYVTKAIEKGDPFEFELRLITAQNQTRYVRSKAICEKDHNQKTKAIFGVFIDVTELVEQKKLFQLSEKALQTHIEESIDGYWDWYIQEDYEYMSPRFWEILGYKPEEQPHKPSAWQALIFKEDLEIALSNFSKHVETKGTHPFDQEVRYRHKNGTTVYIRCRGKVIEWDESGQPLRIIGTHIDITEQKHIENKLKVALHFQKVLLDASTDFIFVKDSSFKIIQANSSFLELYPPEIRDSVIGSTTFESYPADQVEEFLAKDKKAFEEGSSSTYETIDFPDGTKRTLQTHKTRFNDDNNQQYILGIARDVTDIKKTEAELINANSELEEFAYRTSHDLRAPLISTNQLLSIISKDIVEGNSENVLEYIEMAQQSLSKLEALVSNILTMAKSGNTALEKSQVKFADLVNDTLSKLSHLDGYETINIQYQENNDAPLCLIEEHILLIVENMISNAIKYQDPTIDDSFLQIVKHSNDIQHEISFTDNGLGIPRDCQDKLFQMFSRFHAQTAFGSGLGLYMVQKVVTKIGGEIACEHLPNGTKFSIKLPILI